MPIFTSSGINFGSVSCKEGVSIEIRIYGKTVCSGRNMQSDNVPTLLLLLLLMWPQNLQSSTNATYVVIANLLFYSRLLSN